MNSNLLTHSYDNNISNDIYKYLEPLIIETKKVPRDDKLLLFDKLRSLIKKDKLATTYYDKIISDYINNNNNNIDPINKLDAIDLLYIISLYQSEKQDITDLLIEQLRDMQTGFCPQGRTIRLIQIINLFSLFSN